MDLKNYVPSTDNVDVVLKIKDKPLKNEDGSDMTITVMSPYSKEYKKILHKLSNDRIKKQKENEDADMADFEEFALDVLVETTVGWNITWDAKTPEFNKELAREIYENAFWIKILVRDEQNKLVDFTVP